jgi:shikimate kinase
MKSNVALIGFMGAGKSAVGELLARRLHREHLETDSIIVGRTGETIAEIFARRGESYFRELEAETAAEVSVRDRVVISCGGGIVLNHDNINKLKRKAVVVYLDAKPSAILRRVTRAGQVRPLLEVADPAATVNSLLEMRRPLYEQAADIVIDTTDMTIDEVVRDIMAGLSTDECADKQK